MRLLGLEPRAYGLKVACVLEGSLVLSDCGHRIYGELLANRRVTVTTHSLRSFSLFFNGFCTGYRIMFMQTLPASDFRSCDRAAVSSPGLSVHNPANLSTVAFGMLVAMQMYRSLECRNSSHRIETESAEASR
jgi:hypothetical protein